MLFKNIGIMVTPIVIFLRGRSINLAAFMDESSRMQV